MKHWQLLAKVFFFYSLVILLIYFNPHYYLKSCMFKLFELGSV